jgi:hypothetical protein
VKDPGKLSEFIRAARSAARAVEESTTSSLGVDTSNADGELSSAVPDLFDWQDEL